MPFGWTRRDRAVAVTAHNIAAVVDALRARASSIREIERGKSVTVEQVRVLLARGSHVTAHDVAAGVDPVCISGGGVGRINGCKDAALSQKCMVPGLVSILSHIRNPIRCYFATLGGRSAWGV